MSGEQTSVICLVQSGYIWLCVVTNSQINVPLNSIAVLLSSKYIFQHFSFTEVKLSASTEVLQLILSLFKYSCVSILKAFNFYINICFCCSRSQSRSPKRSPRVLQGEAHVTYAQRQTLSKIQNSFHGNAT